MTDQAQPPMTEDERKLEELKAITDRFMESANTESALDRPPGIEIEDFQWIGNVLRWREEEIALAAEDVVVAHQSWELQIARDLIGQAWQARDGEDAAKVVKPLRGAAAALESVADEIEAMADAD
jgi:hypothetical protein